MKVIHTGNSNKIPHKNSCTTNHPSKNSRTGKNQTVSFSWLKTRASTWSQNQDWQSMKIWRRRSGQPTPKPHCRWVNKHLGSLKQVKSALQNKLRTWFRKWKSYQSKIHNWKNNWISHFTTNNMLSRNIWDSSLNLSIKPQFKIKSNMNYTTTRSVHYNSNINFRRLHSLSKNVKSKIGGLKMNFKGMVCQLKTFKECNASAEKNTK